MARVVRARAVLLLVRRAMNDALRLRRHGARALVSTGDEEPCPRPRGRHDGARDAERVVEHLPTFFVEHVESPFQSLQMFPLRHALTRVMSKTASHFSFWIASMHELSLSVSTT